MIKSAGGDPGAVVTKLRNELRSGGWVSKSPKSSTDPPPHSRHMNEAIQRMQTYMKNEGAEKGSLAHLLSALAGDELVMKGLKAGKVSDKKLKEAADMAARKAAA